MGVNAARWIDPNHLRQKCCIIGDQFDWHPARPQYFLAMIDIVEKGVDRANALLNAFRQFAPLARRKHARHNIKRNQPFVGFILAIDIESDPGFPKKGLRLCGFAMEPLDVFAIEPVFIVLIRGADISPATQHFIEQTISPWSKLSNLSPLRRANATQL